MPNSAHIYNLPVAIVPKDQNEKSIGVDCCEEFFALASLTSSAKEFNDTFLAVKQKASVSDSLSFTIKKCGGSTLPNLGTSLSFPQDDLAVGEIYDLRQYLIAYGAGIYIISESSTFLGATIEKEYARIKLWSYTDQKARRTFRIYTEFNNITNVYGQFIDFTGSNASSTLRLKGKFGEWKAQTENKLLVDYAYNSEIPSTTNKNKYVLTIYPCTYMFTKRLIKLHLLAGTYHQITDHNYNHRPYVNFPVQYITETLNQEEPAVEQIITAEFLEYTQNEFSRHNQR